MEQKRNDILALLEHTFTSIGRQTDQLLWERLGIGLAQYRISSTVAESGSSTQRAIAARLYVTEAGVSRQIKLLAEKAYIERMVNTRNKREQIVHVTHKGDRILAAAAGLLQDYSDVSLSQLDERQQKALLSHIGALHNQVCVQPDCRHG